MEKQRWENPDFYQQILKDKEGIGLFSVPKEDFHSNYLLKAALIENDFLSKEKLKNCFLQNNIETRYLWNPMRLQLLYNTGKFFVNDFLV